MSPIDDRLVSVFTSLGTSVDRIAVFRETRSKFLERLPREVRDTTEDDTLIWGLFQLRKSGQLPKAQSRVAGSKEEDRF